MVLLWNACYSGTYMIAMLFLYKKIENSVILGISNKNDYSDVPVGKYLLYTLYMNFYTSIFF